jgi:serine/threonine-protein kinase
MKIAPAQWAVLSELLDQLLELPALERDGWIERLAVDLRSYGPLLRELLQNHAAAETSDFLAAGPVLVDEGEPRAWRAGDRVGPYVLEAEIGHGGMGSVWRAQRADGVLKRAIAVKLPDPGFAALGLARRFAQERDILAALTHPHIARLYDAGFTESRQPFLALEYVEGLPITEYCDRHRLDIARRLRLFLQVLAAVQYAHAHLVVHRDIKPSNALVDADGQASLLDFGIAKLLHADSGADTAQTQVGLRVLTPDYAAPEQFLAGSVTTAADVYSLGVLLFELLTGERPYRPASHSQPDLEAAVTRGEVLRASQAVCDEAKAGARGTTVRGASRSLRGDLDNILAKALQREPADRYRTADAFAQDIERYLRGEPIVARPENPWYRARKFVLRHKAAVAASIAALLGLVATTLIAVQQARIARHERDHALTLSARNESVKDFLNTLITEAAQADKPVTVTDMLSRSESLAAAEFRDSPEDYAAVLDLLGGHYHTIGQDARAAPLYVKAMAAIAGSHDGDLHAELACDQAMTVAALGDPVAATRTLQAVAQARATPDLMAANCLQILSYIAQDAGDGPAALKYATLALERLHRLRVVPPKREGEFLGSVAYSQHLNGNSGEAQRYFALAVRRFVEAGRGSSPDAVAVRNNWAVASNDTGNPRRALELYDELIAGAAQMGSGSPPVYLLANRARSLEMVGRLAQAREAYADCEQAARQLSSPGEVTYCEVGQASAAEELGDLAAAKEHLGAAALLLAAVPPESPAALAVQLIRARVALAEGRIEDARRAVSASIGAHVPISLSTMSLIERARINLHEQQLTAALTDAETALKAAQTLQAGAPYSNRTGIAWLTLGEVQQASNNQQEAQRAFTAAIEQLSNTVDPDHPSLLKARALAQAGH